MPFQNAIKKVLPRFDSLNRKAISGKTDYQIVQDAIGRKLWKNQSVVERIIEDYNQGLASNLKHQPATPIGEIEQILLELQSYRFVSSSILSGNNSIGAKLKLESASLSKFFYHDDYFVSSYSIANRNQIAKSAISKYPNSLNIIIGDSPRDIEAAKAAGVPIIAFPTGQHSINELLVFQPSHILETPTIANFLQILDTFILDLCI